MTTLFGPATDITEYELEIITHNDQVMQAMAEYVALANQAANHQAYLANPRPMRTMVQKLTAIGLAAESVRRIAHFAYNTVKDNQRKSFFNLPW